MGPDDRISPPLVRAPRRRFRRRLSRNTLLAVCLLGAAAGLVVLLSGRGDEPYAEAQRHYEQGDLPAAVVSLERAIAREPGDYRAGWLLARTHLRLGDGAAARAELERLQGAFPLDRSGTDGSRDPAPVRRDVELALLKARILSGEYREVVARLALMDTERDPSASLLLGEAELALGNDREARDAFARVLSLVPTSAEARRGLAQVNARLAQRQPPTAPQPAAAALPASVSSAAPTPAVELPGVAGEPQVPLHLRFDPGTAKGGSTDDPGDA